MYVVFDSDEEFPLYERMTLVSCLMSDVVTRSDRRCSTLTIDTNIVLCMMAIA